MRVLVFHGYLLRGTGSNVYNASLVRALADLGHEVHLLCQERGAEELPFIDAIGTWEEGALRVRTLREPVRCTAYLPDIGRTLPVYVADEYEWFDAKPFPELDDSELDRYLAANVAAARDVAELVSPQAALANHEVMGPAIFARAIGRRVPYAVKVHGSALEYTIRPNRERFVPFAREGLAAAQAVLVGSAHMAERLWDVIADPSLEMKTRLGPPGVETRAFRPRPREEAMAGLRALADRIQGTQGGWGGERDAADVLRRLDPGRDRLVSYVGKLIVSKGVDLLVAAWPLVVARVPEARLCVVGFGTYRGGLGRLLASLSAGDLAATREVAARGRELEGGPPGELRHLAAFLDGLDGDRREAYLAAAPEAAGRVHFTGSLEHGDLPGVLCACEAQVVPSTFPESFGMVAVEAAACGALPLSASHSGLAEVTAALEGAIEAPLRRLLSFEVGPRAVEDIADNLVDWLTLEPARRERATAALARAAHERYGWDRVAQGVLAAAQGRLHELPEPIAADRRSEKSKG